MESNVSKSKVSFFEKRFKLAEHGTDVKTEAISGMTTFMTMAYILAVNPILLSQAGMDIDKVFTATALSSLIATLVMAFHANLPLALAPGMGLNAFFAYTVVMTMGYSWQFALTAVFLEGIIFILLTVFNVREAIINAIPTSLKRGITVGIGLFIAFIGLSSVGIIVNDGATILSLGALSSPSVLLAILGLVIMGILQSRGVKGALFIGILATTVLSMFAGVTALPDQFIKMPAAPYFAQFEWSQIFTIEMAIVLFTFLFVDMFDTVGTLVGVATKADMLDEKGNVPNAKQALMADAVGTTFGALLGTSTVTTYAESASGVAEGGRTGLTALVTAILFGIALFLSPLFTMIPVAATAPALIMVGAFMLSPIKDIDYSDFTEYFPAFVTMIMMPLTYSISEGIVFGLLAYVLLKAFGGKIKEVSALTWGISALFLLSFFIG